MNKILFAPRPITLNTYEQRNELVGYIVDRVDIKYKQTIYQQNTPIETFFVVEFKEHKRGAEICDCQINQLKTTDIVNSYEECKQLVNEKNELLELRERAYYSQIDVLRARTKHKQELLTLFQGMADDDLAKTI